MMMTAMKKMMSVGMIRPMKMTIHSQILVEMMEL